MRTRAGLILVLCLLAGCSKKDPEDRAMMPHDSLKAMHLSEDFHVELFAAEPEVMSPVEMAFDENGKVYVAEMMDYPEDPPAGKPARSRIRLLENPNGDGKIVSAVDLRRKRSGGQRLHAVEGRPDRHQRARHPVPERHGRRRQGGCAQGALYRLPESESGGSHHQPAARRRQLDLLLEHRLRRPHHFAGPSRDGRRFWCAAQISASTRSAARPNPLPGPAQFGSTIDDFGHRFITQNTTHIRHVVVPMKYLARAPLLEVRAVAQDISDHGRPSAPMYPLTGPQDWRKQRTSSAPAALRRKQARTAPNK